MDQQLLEVLWTQRLVTRTVHRVQREHQLDQENLHQVRADGEVWRERAEEPDSEAIRKDYYNTIYY